MQECADSPPAHAPTCTLTALAGSNAGHGSPLCALTTFSRLALKAACASLCCASRIVVAEGMGAGATGVLPGAALASQLLLAQTPFRPDNVCESIILRVCAVRECKS
jgi:hypothetical protein